MSALHTNAEETHKKLEAINLFVVEEYERLSATQDALTEATLEEQRAGETLAAELARTRAQLKFIDKGARVAAAPASLRLKAAQARVQALRRRIAAVDRERLAAERQRDAQRNANDRLRSQLLERIPSSGTHDVAALYAPSSVAAAPPDALTAESESEGFDLSWEGTAEGGSGGGQSGPSSAVWAPRPNASFDAEIGGRPHLNLVEVVDTAISRRSPPREAAQTSQSGFAVMARSLAAASHGPLRMPRSSTSFGYAYRKRNSASFQPLPSGASEFVRAGELRRPPGDS